MSAVRDAFLSQRDVCAAMGSPFTARLCALAAARLAPGGRVADRVLGWQGEPSGAGDALPLRFAGALHALVLLGRSPGLAAVYPPAQADDEALWSAVGAAMLGEADYILTRLEGPPQTNEPMRSAALAPGYLTVAAQTGLPLRCSEIGASAGLNLLWDRFAYGFGPASWGDPASPVRLHPDWRGAPPPLPTARVIERAGCDLAPLDPADPDTELRLMSFVWADQTLRLDRLRAALQIAREVRPKVERADAGDWLARRLAERHPASAHVVAHSIMWQYLPEPAQTRIAGLIAAAGARATAEAPVAWLRLERDDSGERGAAITLTLWPGGTERLLGRADFHGSWVEWHGR